MGGLGCGWSEKYAEIKRLLAEGFSEFQMFFQAKGSESIKSYLDT
jgi:hypothetical protein